MDDRGTPTMTATGFFSIGTSDRGHISFSQNDGGSTLTTMVSPAMARIYGAMLMALADTLDPPAATEEPQ